MREVPIVNESATDPSVELPAAKWLEPACPTCGDRLFAMPQPNAERLSHICRNGHKWRND
jgi:hypothetical protein